MTIKEDRLNTLLRYSSYIGTSLSATGLAGIGLGVSNSIGLTNFLEKDTANDLIKYSSFVFAGGYLSVLFSIWYQRYSNYRRYSNKDLEDRVK